MPKKTREYEKRPDVMLKRYIKNHQEDYVAKRQAYAKNPEVKKRRQHLNKIRRRLSTDIIRLLKEIPLVDEQGNRITILNNHIVSLNEKCVLKIDKEGKIYRFPFTEDKEILWNEGNYEITEKSENKKEFERLMTMYKNGLIEVPITKKTLNHLTVVIKSPDDANCNSN
jgi:hypothetical protein